ncbi:MAG: hypothetical protein PWQ37_2969 [Candidatus Petromonas sp.]|jgi:hypothetical protein|nr:hypothetical protein [Clostridia bacterium]MDK2920236.1 hypothetical protein [Candidatus Petromonas sp.]
MYYIFILNDIDLGEVNFTGKEITDTLLDKSNWLFNDAR